jgi:NAD(P)-dependent dehydrogenase (short-subunit alcohol dehydrogenase family)
MTHTMPEQLLTGQGVVITGAGRGLGRAFALAVAREGAGVVVNDVDVEEAEKVVAEIEAAGGRAVASGASVADWDQAGGLIETCVREFGAIDGLVNNAVAYMHYGPPWEVGGDAIRTMVEVAVMGTLFCGTHAMREMVPRGKGNIVNVTSRTHIGVGGMSTYVATKGAVASATYAWALDLLEKGIRVNGLAPGAWTRGHELAGAHADFAKRNQRPPELVAPALVYLLSHLSRPLTGQIVAMLGGRLGLMAHPRMFDEFDDREQWTAREVAEVMERHCAGLLQPVGVEGVGPEDWARFL